MHTPIHNGVVTLTTTGDFWFYVEEAHLATWLDRWIELRAIPGVDFRGFLQQLLPSGHQIFFVESIPLAPYLPEVQLGIQMTRNATKVFQRVHFGIGDDARILLQRPLLNCAVNDNLASELGILLKEGRPIIF
jgi:hypothetical protein